MQEVDASLPPAARSEMFRVALDAALVRGEEGLMIKECNSQYIVNERAQHWYKLKSDMLNGYGVIVP